MKNELGPLGGAGHFFGNDRKISEGGRRDFMQENEIRNVLKLLSLGTKQVNFKEREVLVFRQTELKKNSSKFRFYGDFKVELDGWRIQYKEIGAGEPIVLWLSNKSKGEKNNFFFIKK